MTGIQGLPAGSLVSVGGGPNSPGFASVSQRSPGVSGGGSGIKTSLPQTGYNASGLGSGGTGGGGSHPGGSGGSGGSYPHSPAVSSHMTTSTATTGYRQRNMPSVTSPLSSM